MDHVGRRKGSWKIRKIILVQFVQQMDKYYLHIFHIYNTGSKQNNSFDDGTYELGLTLRLANCFGTSIVQALHDDRSGRAVCGTNCLRLPESWDRGFESHLMHGSLRAFVPCLCCK